MVHLMHVPKKPHLVEEVVKQKLNKILGKDAHG